MIAPETLLKMHPLEAVRMQIQEKVRAPLKATHLNIAKPVSLGGLRTRVHATIDKKNAPVELWDRVGELVFEYDRLDLGSFTDGMDTFRSSQLPTASDELLRALLSPYDVVVDSKDVVPAIYTELGVAEIIAGDESYRWIGSMIMTISGQAFEITTLIRNTTFTLPFTASFNSSSVLTDLVLRLNLTNPGLPKAISTSMLTVDLPEQIGADDEGENTRLMLTFNGIPYLGSFPVIYQRRSFPKSFRYSIKLSGPQVGNATQLASLLSASMGCTITAADIASQALTVLPVGSKQEIAVNFHKDSLAYVGSILVEYSRTV